MVTQCPNRPARGSASALRVGLPPLGGHIGITSDCGLFQRVERARSRDVQGGAAGPRSGRKRSAPRSSPLAAAATTPYGSDAMNYFDVTDPRTSITGQSPAGSGSNSSTNARIIHSLHPIEHGR